MAGERDLDVRIAREVFGYEVVPCTDTIHVAGVRCPEWRINARDEDDFLSSQPAVPRYSSDIGAAWLIVDEFASRHIPCSLYSMSHGVWFCFFGYTPLLDPTNPLKPTHEARANTPAEAICRAAINALAATRGGSDMPLSRSTRGQPDDLGRKVPTGSTDAAPRADEGA